MQPGLQRGHQGAAALGVGQPGLAQGAGKVAHLDELGQRGLQGHLAGAVEVVVGLLEVGHQRLGHHQVAQFQPRIQHLGEGAHVEHAAIVVQPLQRRHGRPAEAELAVVVVFQHPGVVGAGGGQQLVAAGQRHDGPAGVLVRWRDVHQPGRVAVVVGPGGDAFAIHRHRVHGQAGGHEGFDRAPVGGVFDPHGVAVVGQQLGAQLQRLLGAAGDDDLVGVELHAAEHAHVVGHGAAQRAVAAAVVVVEHVGAGVPPVLVLQPLPQRHRKGAEIGRTGGEGLYLQLAGIEAVRQRLASCRQATGAVGQVARQAGGRLCGGPLWHGPSALAHRGWRCAQRLHAVGHKGAAAHMTDEVALDRELADGGHHGVARHAQVLRQVAAGGQTLARTQLAVEHGAAQRLVQLAVQRQGGLAGLGGGVQSGHLGQQQFRQHGSAGCQAIRLQSS